MKTATLTRMPDDLRQTLGVITSTDGQGFTAKTLELPWKENDNNISCIPKGEYPCRYTRSPRLSAESLARWLKKNQGAKEADCPEEIKNIYTYEIFDAQNRAGCRFHAANFARQLRGCVALGSGTKDIDMDGMNDVTHSGNTIAAFEKFMNYEPFKLIIK